MRGHCAEERPKGAEDQWDEEKKETSPKSSDYDGISGNHLYRERAKLPTSSSRSTAGGAPTLSQGR